MFSEQERSTYPLGAGVGRLKRKQVEVVEADLETLLEASGWSGKRTVHER